VRVEPGPILVTERLVLRRWRSDDLEPFAAINADPAVMEYFPNPLTRDQSDAFARRVDGIFDRFGYGLFAVEVRGGQPFVGFVGLSPFAASDPSPLPFAPGVEVGWRLAHGAWGNGYAPEAAAACLELGFDAGLEEIVSFTSVLNERSQSVMRRIGMHRDPADDFDHPRLAESDPLRPHVLYRARRTSG
jgi:ribosomal-protein-alanine N-acetyltransferase